MNDIYSFYQLISKYQIEIPIIQRDYAQGRNNPKAADVRKSLVGNMIKAVKEGKLLFFDFVYGRVDNNKFIPFDGQQRLTTLFLFHKYVFEKCQSDSDCNHKDNCSCRGILGRFSYATRQSSREFCKKLVENNIIPDDKYKNQLRETFIAALKKEDNEKEKKADEFIKSIDNWIYRFVTNQSWFYPDWEKDPTVMGMLTMLDEIHCQMRNETDFKTFAEKLTSGCNCPITFHFVDMGEHKMSDETYVKMNARGKTLTPFENFKASLEQYLEDKKLQDLQNRLKNKIDGDWLDLFWNINGNVLPDTLMMSFFNRHFMNVWRSWYAKKSEKKDEYDAFNTRIQKEMPLYPTKDDFVPFDIYEYVIDKCGVENCLSPIFNIFDALSAPNNTIENDCQAVWNRNSNETKWSIFNGYINNQNRETYPSRIAFYATMKYFQNENYSDTTSLSQWMRVVWNIIENSTIDSSDTYHAALRLIEKLSAKSHTIYNALANEFESFELGNQYHAQEQVAEEIAKAKQILDEDGNLCKYNGSCNKEDGSDYQTWEEIIIEAEKYSFFKGAIRFLFTNGEGWSDFDTKWENAQKYFDENGVKDADKNYKTEALLLKAVLYQEKDFWTYIEPPKYVFDNKAETWKSNILLEKGWEEAVHQILMGNIKIQHREGDCLIYKNLYDSNLLNYVSKYLEGSRIRWIHDHRAIYPPRYEGIILDDDIPPIKFYRNNVLSSDNRLIVSQNQEIENCNFFKGWDVKFKYKKEENNLYEFEWNTDGKVYLLEEGSWKRKNENEFFCYDVNGIDDVNKLIKILEEIIAEAYSEQAG